MSLPRNLFSTAFKRQRLGLMMALIMGIMVYLGSLAMAAQAVLARTSLTWGHDLQNRLTVEIPAQPDDTQARQEARAQKVADALRGEKGVSAVTLLPLSETARLLEPWIPDAGLLGSLPLPRLVDVEYGLGQTIDTQSLQQKADQIAEGAKIHRHEQGMAQILGFLRGLGGLAVFMLFLTGVALVAIVSIICRAAMAVQHETIELLHFMGATDLVIAKQFQSHICRLSIPSAAVGFIGAMMTAGLLVLLLGSLGGLSLVSTVSWLTVGGMMAFVPLAATGLAMVTARLAVLRLLRGLV